MSERQLWKNLENERTHTHSENTNTEELIPDWSLQSFSICNWNNLLQVICSKWSVKALQWWNEAERLQRAKEEERLKWQWLLWWLMGFGLLFSGCFPGSDSGCFPGLSSLVMRLVDRVPQLTAHSSANSLKQHRIQLNTSAPNWGSAKRSWCYFLFFYD